MFTVKNSAVQYACFAVLGFREAALNLEGDYNNLLSLYGQGEAELIAEFEAVGTYCSEIYSTLLHVIPSAPRGLFEYEVPQKLGAEIAKFLLGTGNMLWWEIAHTTQGLVIDYYIAGCDGELDGRVIDSIAATFTAINTKIAIGEK